MSHRLSTKILIPNLVIVIATLSLLAATVLLIVHFYLVQESVKELGTVRETMQKLVLAGTLNTSQDDLTQAQAARITRQASLLFDVKAVILTEDMKYANSASNAPLPESLLTNMKPDGGIYRFRYGGKSFAATTVPFKTATGNWSFLIFTGMDAVNAFSRRLAAIMLLALAGAVLVALLASAYVARRIAGPLRKLSLWAHTIGGRQFRRYEDVSGTAEIDFLAASLNSMTQRLADYDDAQKRFLQNASHELRTPLMSIQGYAEGIEHGVFPDTAAAAGIIVSESLRLSALVDDLLYLSRLETTEDSYRFDPLPLTEVVSRTVEKLEGAAIKEGKTLLLEPCPDVSVSGDGEKLLRAMLNLAANCLRYASVTVTIACRVEAGRAIVTVRDDGPGFDPEDLPHLFTRFYKGKQGKFGLGLSIAKAIVDHHGGRIAASNAPEGGAVFTVEIPCISLATSAQK